MILNPLLMDSLLQSAIGFAGRSAYVRPMRINFIIIIIVMALVFPFLSQAEAKDGCSPELQALAESAVVELKGSGEMDIVVVTDPLCWHCRLGHKLLGEYPNLYGRLKLVFFPRKGFIGSDMAAWIMEDAAGTDRLKELVDFAYDDLKQPKGVGLAEARMIILSQFAEEFPYLIEGTTLPELSVRLERDHGAHVLKCAELARAAGLPGTPVLVAGRSVVIGYGPGHWIKVLERKETCQ